MSARNRLVLLAATIAFAVAAGPALGSSPAPDRGVTRDVAGAPPGVSTPDWPTYERTPGHSSGMFGDDAITPSNAGSLVERWRFTAAKATFADQPPRRFDASPTVVDGRVYIGSRSGMFYVLDADTGAVIWRKLLDYGSSTYCGPKGMLGTATVEPDPVTGVLTVYVPGAHYLYALDAATGATRWRAAIGPDSAQGRALYLIWSSPTVVGGRIFLGLGARCDTHPIRGGVVSVNQHTGAVEGTYYDVPAGKIGASVWSSQASVGGPVFVTTGNPNPSGTTLDDAYSVVRVSPTTMAREDKWTIQSGQAADLDFGSSPTLYAADINGVSTKLVTACNKNGLLYAWRRSDLAAGPVWTRRVGATDSVAGGACRTSPALDYLTHRLFVAANRTTIGGVVRQGGVRALDPATGAVIWQKGMPCQANGSPTLNGQVLAVPMYGCPNGVPLQVKLYRESDGSFVGSVPETSDTFAQPVFADGQLFVAGEDGTVVAYGP